MGRTNFRVTEIGVLDHFGVEVVLRRKRRRSSVEIDSARVEDILRSEADSRADAKSSHRPVSPENNSSSPSRPF
jgi:hypothetical protein